MYIVNAQLEDASWYSYLHNVSFLFVDESLCDGRLDRDLPFLDVGLMGADDGEPQRSVFVEIGEFYIAEQLHGIGLAAGRIKHARISQDALFEADATVSTAPF